MKAQKVRESIIEAREQLTRALRAVSVPNPSTGDLVIAIQDARAALGRAVAEAIRQEETTA